MHKILVKTVNGSSCEVREIEGSEISLEYLQGVVGGLIEIPFISSELRDRGIDVVINEEGKLIGLEPNIAIMENKGLLDTLTDSAELSDILMGDVMFMSVDEDGASIGLSDEQIEYVKGLIDNKGVILSGPKGIKMLSYIKR